MLVPGCRRSKELSQAEQKFEGSVSATLRAAPSHRSAGQAACRRAQRKPDTPTQVNDTPRTFSKGRMGLQQKQKLPTTQQARWARGCALLDRAPHRADLVRCAPFPCARSWLP
eukprot:scaffold16922_cov51-Phaeocystis_antarctica.AAC.2